MPSGEALNAPRSAYDHLASTYDLLAAFYSGGGISRAKHAALEFLESPSEILIVGVGSGSECPALLRAGHKVLALDSSAAMLERLERRARASLRLTAVQGDFWNYTPSNTIDAVLLPFFLNTLEPTKLRPAFERASSWLRPGGKVIVSDFRGPRPGLFGGLQELYHLVPLCLFRLLTGNPWHRLYQLDHLSSQVVPSRRLSRAWGVPLFESLCWVRS